MREIGGARYLSAAISEQFHIASAVWEFKRWIFSEEKATKAFSEDEYQASSGSWRGGVARAVVRIRRFSRG
jgi:hypothetical protein